MSSEMQKALEVLLSSEGLEKVAASLATLRKGLQRAKGIKIPTNKSRDSMLAMLTQHGGGAVTVPTKGQLRAFTPFQRDIVHSMGVTPGTIGIDPKGLAARNHQLTPSATPHQIPTRKDQNDVKTVMGIHELHERKVRRRDVNHDYHQRYGHMSPEVTMKEMNLVNTLPKKERNVAAGFRAKRTQKAQRLTDDQLQLLDVLKEQNPEFVSSVRKSMIQEQDDGEYEHLRGLLKRTYGERALPFTETGAKIPKAMRKNLLKRLRTGETELFRE